MASGEDTPKVYTLEEVAKHSTEDDMWLVIHNKVYDVTSFLEEHPGGVEVLLETAGQESTYAFEDVGHSLDARELLDQYYIGDLHKDDHTKGFTEGAEVTTSEGSGLSSSIVLGIGVALAATVSFYFFNRI